MPEPLLHNQPEYSVSEISASLKRVVEDNFGFIRVRGEISGFKRATSGHLYFNLKDEQSVLNAICWKGTKLSFAPEDGIEVVAAGRLTTYPGRSQYQLVVSDMTPAGAGALMALFEKRKAQLAAEGLFDLARKKSLPLWPRTIGVITSPTGAVIRDILHRIAERFPTHVLLWPVAVQGEDAAAQVAAAIRGFNALDHAKLPKPDLLIVARGGGSLEDLWAFNEEIVVRAAAESRIPLISAIGHETDTTLLDYAADRRAPTPTAAAELAVPVREEFLLAVQEYGQRLRRSLRPALDNRTRYLTALARSLGKPARLLEAAAQRLDEAQARLAIAPHRLLERKTQRLATLAAHTHPAALQRELHHLTRRLSDSTHALRHDLHHGIETRARRLSTAARLLEVMSYTRTLERGFAVVLGPRNTPVTRAAQARPNMPVTLEFADGACKALIADTTSPKPAKSAKKSISSNQGDLF